MIDPALILNGTIWEARHPLCWQVLLQWIDEDQWLVLSVPEKAIHGGTCLVVFSHGPIIKTKREVVALLNQWQATQVNGAKLRLVTPDTEHQFEVNNGTHIARCVKCGYQQYSALPVPNKDCPNVLTPATESDTAITNSRLTALQ